MSKRATAGKPATPQISLRQLRHSNFTRLAAVGSSAETPAGQRLENAGAFTFWTRLPHQGQRTPKRCNGGDLVSHENPADEWSPASVERMLDLFAGRWVLPILKSLEGGPLRRNALKAQLGVVSDKVLTETLQRLTAHRLVDRTAIPTVPVEVNYALTERARGLRPLLATIAGGRKVTPMPSTRHRRFPQNNFAETRPEPAHSGMVEALNAAGPYGVPSARSSPSAPLTGAHWRGDLPQLTENRCAVGRTACANASTTSVRRSAEHAGAKMTVSTPACRYSSSLSSTADEVPCTR